MKRTVRPLYYPLPLEEPAESGHVILRDGSTAQVRLSQPEDFDAMQAFIQRLSPDSRRHRFFSESSPPPDLIRSFCDSSDPRSMLTLVVIRIRDGTAQIIAAGSYMGRDERTAEVAMAVDEEFQGKGLGTLLLERLALLAVRNGFTSFWAATHAENRPMRDVFRDSGFPVRETFEGDDMEVKLSVLPDESSVARSSTRDRVATLASLRPFFQPRAVAVVGASRDPSSIGFRTIEALVSGRFQGPVYPVNPRATVVGSIRAYPSIGDVPDRVDLAILIVPRDVVLEAVEACAAHGVRALIVITAGFAELGPEGRELQNRLLEKVRGHGMRMVGPNCLGLLNTAPDVHLNASFSPVFPPPGRIAMLSQSGALGLSILSAAGRLHLGLSTFVSVGNKADVSSNDLLQYWEDDERTDVILLYLESFGNPRRFAPIARRVSRRKPIVAVRGGRTGAGSRAAGSHTAALAASDAGVEALFRQTGIIRADTLEEMFALAEILGSQPLPKGRRVAIISNAGGPAILCADACEASGLVVSELSSRTRETLASFLPSAASCTNPIDLIASAGPEQYRRTIEAVMAAEEVDAVIIIYIPVDMRLTEEVSEAVRSGITAGRTLERKQGSQRTSLALCWMSEGKDEGPFELPEGERIPRFSFPEMAGLALGKSAIYAEWRSQPIGITPDFEDMDIARARETCRHGTRDETSGWLSAADTRAVLNASGLPLPRGGLATSADEAAEWAQEIGYPVVVKLASHRILHKTEIGAVRQNLGDEAAVRLAFEEIRHRLEVEGEMDAMEGVLVQPMLTEGVEVMVGATHDPMFGPLIAFGLGGIHVEILGDVRFRVAPLTDRDASSMIREIRGFRLLTGYRGHQAADLEALEEALLRVSLLVEEIPEIKELDLNPVFAFPPGKGCCIVDARIRVEL